MKTYFKPQAKLLSAKQTLLTVSDPEDVANKGLGGYNDNPQLGKDNKNTLWN